METNKAGIIRLREKEKRFIVEEIGELSRVEYAGCTITTYSILLQAADSGCSLQWPPVTVPHFQVTWQNS